MYYDTKQNLNFDNPNRTFKVVVSGHVVEVYEYEDVVKSEKSYIKNHDWGSDEKGDRSRENQKRSRTRTATNVRRLALMNFNSDSVFLTLTFAPNQNIDVTDVIQTNKEFKKFMQRLRYKFNDFKYLSVIEFQDKNGRGAVHYHVLLEGLPFIPANKTYAVSKGLGEDIDTFESIWGLGFVKVNKIKHVDNVGAYIIKYLLKNLDDKRLKGKFAYLQSKNLDKPVELTDYADIQRIVNAMALDTTKPIFKKEWMSEYIGQVIYREFNLHRN